MLMDDISPRRRRKRFASALLPTTGSLMTMSTPQLATKMITPTTGDTHIALSMPEFKKLFI